MKAMKNILSLALVLVIAAGAMAADEEKKGKGKGKKGQRKAPSATARFVGKLDLSAEQKEKIAEIDKEFGGKVAELRKKQTSILTEDQVKARKDAFAAVKKSGKKGPEARKSVEAAVKLSDDQKKQMTEAQKASKELNGQILGALKKILTEEQIKNLPGGNRRKGQGAAKKPGTKKPGAKKGAAKKGEAKKGAAKKDAPKKNAA